MKAHIFILDGLSKSDDTQKNIRQNILMEGVQCSSDLYLSDESNDYESTICEIISKVEKESIQYPIIIWLSHGKHPSEIFNTESGSLIFKDNLNDIFKNWTTKRNLLIIFCACYGNISVNMLKNEEPSAFYYGIIAPDSTIEEGASLSACNLFLKKEVEEINKEKRDASVIDIVSDMNLFYNDAVENHNSRRDTPFHAYQNHEQMDLSNFFDWITKPPESDEAKNIATPLIECIKNEYLSYSTNPHSHPENPPIFPLYIPEE